MLRSLLLAAAAGGPAPDDRLLLASIPWQLVVVALLVSVSVATFLSMRALREEEEKGAREHDAIPADAPAPAITGTMLGVAWPVRAPAYFRDAASRAASPAWAPRGQNRA